MKIIDMRSDGFTPDQIIEFRKLLGKQIKNAKGKSRHQKCLLCDQPGGFCNSHTIPQFCLENIAWNGNLNSFNTLMDTDLLSKDSGINNAGTFHIICKSCDGKKFQEYENPTAYASAPTDSMLNQIALKTVLRDIYKHEMEVEMYEASKQMLKEKSPFLSFFFSLMINAQIDARTIDLKECYDTFNKAKECLSTKKHWLRMISYDTLPFTSPIAFQGMVALVTGVNGEIINNIFNHSKDYRIEYLHIAVFPLKDSTAIILFLDEESSRYKQFEDSLSKFSLEERLEIVNRIIFLYTEDYYLSKQLKDEIIDSLKEPAKTLQDLATCNPKKSIRNAVKDFDLRRDFCMPNLFLKDFAVVPEMP